MAYDLTNITNSSSFLEFAVNVDGGLGGHFFGYSVLIILFSVTFLTLKGKGYTMGASATVGAWMLTISALFLRAMGLIDNWVFWACLLATPIAVFAIFFFGNPD